MNAWLMFRVVVVLLGALGGWVMVQPEAHAEPHTDWWSPLVALPSAALIVLALVGFQSFTNPSSRLAWVRPDWRTNPFDFSQPLQFFHLAAWNVLATGTVAILVVTFARTHELTDGLTVLGVGMGLWVGTQLAARVFMRRRAAQQ